MKTVKVTQGYKDLQLGRQVKVGETFEVDNDRAEELIKAKVAQIVTEEKTHDLTPPLKSPEEFRALEAENQKLRGELELKDQEVEKVRKSLTEDREQLKRDYEAKLQAAHEEKIELQATLDANNAQQEAAKEPTTADSEPKKDRKNRSYGKNKN